MRKGKFSIISSAGKVIVATIKFEDGDVWDICKKGYDLNQSQNNKSCWVEENQIYLDDYRDRKLKQKLSSKTVKSQSHQQNQDPQQTNVMSIQDCITKQTVLLKTCLPIDTREALADSNNAFDNFSLKLNKAARFDCRVKIENYKGIPCKPCITDDLRYTVRYEDEEGCNIGTSGNAKYLSISRPLTDHEKKVWLESNPEASGNTDDAGKKIAIKKRSAIKKLFEQSKYAERKFRFSETDKEGLLYQPTSFFGNLDFREIAERHCRSIQALNLSVSSCEGAIDWRMIVGLGNESVYETSMTLHHVYGIPYIPSSAVKGIVRSWMITEVFSDVGADCEEENYPFVNAEYRAYQDEGFCKIFGCPAKTKKVIFENREPDKANGKYRYETCVTALEKEHQGRLWFFDAFLLSKPEIEVDIMNPHYGDYYADKKANGNPVPPADYLKPNPISFLTVGEKDKKGNPLRFQFLMGIKEKDNEAIGEGSRLLKDSNGFPIKVRKKDTNELVKESSDTRLLNITEAWLKKALEEHGIGAKTAVGYGYMQGCNTGDAK